MLNSGIVLSRSTHTLFSQQKYPALYIKGQDTFLYIRKTSDTGYTPLIFIVRRRYIPIARLVAAQAAIKETGK